MEIQGFITIALIILAAYAYSKIKQRRQLAYIQSYQFHPALEGKIKTKYPHLSTEQIATVFDALRDYFTFCKQAKNRMVAMPSQVVDIAWHEFILFTRAYDTFSKKAIGRFLHHTPTEAMKTPTLAQDGIKRAWRLACAKEKISPSSPKQLPLLFAIDSTLNIEDGFTYSLNCKDKASSSYGGGGYCAGHIGCASGCGGDSGGSSGSGGFFGGSDGGSDCGGGGCGGD